MSTRRRGVLPEPVGGESAQEPFPASPLEALASAFSDAVNLLLNPFALPRWIRLSAVCLFLGGGATSAAFQWSLSTLPDEVAFQDALFRLRAYIAQHTWLILLSTAVGLSLAVVMVYLRAVCRFVLVDSILREEIRIRRALAEVRPLAHSYFFWLLGALGIVGTVLGVGILLMLPFWPLASSQGESLAYLLAETAVLATQVLVGLAFAVVIILTDDLAVPVMYVERLPLLAAWQKLWRIISAEAGTFTLYVVLRLVVAVAVGIAVLFVLFPALVVFFSGAIMAAALVVLVLHLAGGAWVWTPVTIVLAALALVLLIGLLLLLLGVAGMPGQVLLQSFGMRFLASRVPALDALWRTLPLRSSQE